MAEEVPRIFMHFPNHSTQLDMLHFEFLSLSELELDDIIQTMTKSYEQINRKYRETKRYHQIIKRLQISKRIEKDCQEFFHMRYTETAMLEDSDIQNFIKSLPANSFLQAALKLTLNDLRAIKNYHLEDIAKYLLPHKVIPNKHHTKILKNIPEYKHFLSETHTSLPDISCYIETPNAIELAPTTNIGVTLPSTSTSTSTSNTNDPYVPTFPSAILPYLPASNTP